MVEPVHRGVQHLAQLLEAGAQLGLLLVGDRPVVERRAPVGAALEDGERLDLVDDGGDDLHAARGRADDGDALSLEVEGLDRPRSGVVLHAAKVVTAGDVREVRNGQHACRARDVARSRRGAGVGRGVLGCIRVVPPPTRSTSTSGGLATTNIVPIGLIWGTCRSLSLMSMPVCAPPSPHTRSPSTTAAPSRSSPRSARTAPWTSRVWVRIRDMT